MILYPESSIIVRAFTHEVGSADAERWLHAVEAGQLATSAWCETEIASALSLKVRTGELAYADRMPLFDLIVATLSGTALRLPVDIRHFGAATDLLNRSVRPLRGGDALHLAIAADAGARLWTLDRRMAEAGMALGLDVALLQ